MKFKAKLKSCVLVRAGLGLLVRFGDPFVLLALLCVSGCNGQDAEPDERMHVLLITIDSLRADRLGCYGYARETSPNLDQLAAEGVRFERAYSHAPFTPPAHASLLTSLHVPSHGILGWTESLGPEVRTLGERFASRDYRTGAFYNHPGLRSSQVFRGFEVVQERVFEEAGLTIDAYLNWLDEDSGASCSWVHLWDVHRPYGYRNWDTDWYRELVDRDSMDLAYNESRFGEAWDVRVGREEDHYNLSRAKRSTALPLRGPDGRVQEQKVFRPGDYRHIRDRYDGGIASADEALGRLFAELKQRGLWDNLLVVVTADHGEALTEREACFFTHDPFLFEETLRVPLLMKLPKSAGSQWRSDVSTLVRGVDVLPTLLEFAELPSDGREQGVSLVPWMRSTAEGEASKQAPAVGPLLAQTQTRNSKEKSAKVTEGWLEHRQLYFDGQYKLIRDHSAQSWSLFDLGNDPKERADLLMAGDGSGAQQWKERADQYEQSFKRLYGGLPKPGAVDVGTDEEVLNMLKGIGYIEDGPDVLDQ